MKVVWLYVALVAAVLLAVASGADFNFKTKIDKVTKSAPVKSSNRFLWKTYKNNKIFESGSRFRVGELDNYEICQEVADMYNIKPSVLAANALVFSCGTED